MKARHLLRAGATTITAATVLVVAAVALSASAHADPPTIYRQFPGVGSEVSAQFMNAVAGDVSGTPALVDGIASYDSARPSRSTYIRTRANGNDFYRPDSGSGVRALSDSITGVPYGGNGTDITNQVSFARSISGPAYSGTDLTYVPFARDSIVYAYRGNTDAMGSLTSAQLAAVFSADSPVTINGTQITGVYLMNSDVSSELLKSIGVTTLGASVIRSNKPDNDASILTTNQIVAFSAAQWIAQKNGLTIDTTAGARLGAAGGIPAFIKNADGTLSARTTYANSAPFGRFVYNVIASSAATSSSPLGAKFIGASSPLCSSSGQSLAGRYGFAAITAASGSLVCGAASVTGGYLI